MAMACPTEFDPTDCVGFIDCALFESSMELQDIAGNVVDELSCTEPTCIFLTHWDCEGNYVPLDGTEGVDEGPGSIDYDSIDGLVTKWIYTPTGVGDVDVTLKFTGENGGETCFLDIPVAECTDRHFEDIAEVRSKDTLTPSGRINDIGPGSGTLIIEDLDFTGAAALGQRTINVENYDNVIVRRCCIPGLFTPTSGDIVSFNDIGIRGRKIKKFEVYDCTISGYYHGVEGNDNDQVIFERNVVFDCAQHHLMSVLCRNTVPGGSSISRNFCYYTQNVDEPTRSNDMIHVFNPVYQGRTDLLVKDNLTIGYKGDNGSGIIVDAFYTTAFNAAGVKLGGVLFETNTTIDSIVQGIGITTGEHNWVFDNHDYSDIPLPANGATNPTSNGLGYAVADYTNPIGGQVPYPNFVGHRLERNDSYHISNTGNEQRFFGTPSSAYTLVGNNFSGNGMTLPEDPPPFTRQECIDIAATRLQGLFCYQ